MYDNLDQGRRAGLDRPLPRPAPADHPAHPGVPADAPARPLLAGLREEPAAAAHLRHRLGEPGRAQGAPAAARRGREARPPPARRRAGPVQLPGGARLRARRSSTPRAASSGGRWRTTSGSRHEEGRLRVRQHPAHHQGAAVRDLRPPGLVLRRRHVPAHGAGGRELLPQADELPDAQPDLPVPRPVVPGAAAADVRVRHRLPVREVRRRARAHPGARPDHGRRAHLLHPGAGGRGAGLAAAVRARPAGRLRAGRLLPGAVHPQPGEVDRLRGGLGGRHRDPAVGRRASPVSTSYPTRAAPRSTGRRSRCRPGTRSAGPGRCRPSSWTSTCRSGSSWNTRPPTGRGSGRS